jgi:hypothetical protein
MRPHHMLIDFRTYLAQHKPSCSHSEGGWCRAQHGDRAYPKIGHQLILFKLMISLPRLKGGDQAAPRPLRRHKHRYSGGDTVHLP